MGVFCRLGGAVRPVCRPCAENSFDRRPCGLCLLSRLDIRIVSGLRGNRVKPGRTDFMGAALAEAEAAAARGEVPIGAVLVSGSEIVARAGNRTRELSDPTAHAEMLVIREAATRLASERLGQADLYVTLEPCAMCAGAISFARIRRLYFGAADAKGGAVVSG